MTPELMAVLIERARVDQERDDHMARYPDWWAATDATKDRAHPATVEWAAHVDARLANDREITRLARELAAAATSRAA